MTFDCRSAPQQSRDRKGAGRTWATRPNPDDLPIRTRSASERCHRLLPYAASAPQQSRDREGAGRTWATARTPTIYPIRTRSATERCPGMLPYAIRPPSRAATRSPIPPARTGAGRTWATRPYPGESPSQKGNCSADLLRPESVLEYIDAEPEPRPSSPPAPAPAPRPSPPPPRRPAPPLGNVAKFDPKKLATLATLPHPQRPQ